MKIKFYQLWTCQFLTLLKKKKKQYKIFIVLNSILFQLSTDSTDEAGQIK